MRLREIFNWYKVLYLSINNGKLLNIQLQVIRTPQKPEVTNVHYNKKLYMYVCMCIYDIFVYACTYMFTTES